MISERLDIWGYKLPQWLLGSIGVALFTANTYFVGYMARAIFVNESVPLNWDEDITWILMAVLLALAIMGSGLGWRYLMIWDHRKTAVDPILLPAVWPANYFNLARFVFTTYIFLYLVLHTTSPFYIQAIYLLIGLGNAYSAYSIMHMRSRT